MNEPLDLNPQAAEQLRAACESFRAHVDRFGSFVARLEAVQLRPKHTPDPEPPQ